MTTRPRVALTLLAALFALALPAAASAVEYEVDSPADEPALTTAACLTAGGNCTLRAAIEVADATTAISDEITFDDSVFEGKTGDTIAPATVLPPLSSPVAVKGGTCETTAGVDGPCVEIDGPSGEVGLEVTADGSSISGLSLTGLSFGIVIGSSSSNVVIQGNWIGVRLDGSVGANSNFGIFVDPNSDGATIGGTEVVQRNVIANTTGTGLDLEGASEATIQGNYFGVGVDGETTMANGKNIEITDREGFIPSEDVKAENNEIGATVEGAAATSAACDGGCNVISGALGTGIDLNGSPIQVEKPATGPTLVHGNFVGLDASGTQTVANGGFAGIWAGGADDVTVGGTAAGDANYLFGGSEGIVSENGNGFKALGNVIGFGSDGSDQTPPAENGIYALNQSVSEDSKIENNLIRMIGGVGIEAVSLTGRIIGNEIRGGNRGIVAGFGDGGGLIASNEVDASGEFGILIESAKNDVRDNTVTSSNGPGIAVKPPKEVTATIGNVIGGSSTGTENVIDGSAGPAIQIVEEAGEPGSWTEITRNRGAANGGLFIDLVTGANKGILLPVISSATQTKAGGTAEPNATIRLFRKATAGAGEVEAFLAETEADGSGNWAVAYSSIPAGTNLAATQTVIESGTSELALTTAAADPSGGGNGGGGNNGGGGGTPDTTAPTVKITKAPKTKSKSTTGQVQVQGERGWVNVPVQARQGQVQELPLAEDLQEAEARQARLQGPGDGQGGQRRQAGKEELHGSEEIALFGIIIN